MKAFYESPLWDKKDETEKEKEVKKKKVKKDQFNACDKSEIG